MKKIGTKLLSLLCVLALLAGLAPAAVAAVPMGGAEVAETASGTEASVPGGDRRTADAPAEVSAGEHTLWLVGDSTVCDYADDADGSYFYKRCGYGTALKAYVDDTYTVQNLAISGESSKSFLTSANYATLTGASGMKSGDVLIIGFGHNDEKSDKPSHYTTPGGTSTTEGSFAKSLYDNYVKKAQDVGATPILCTPIVRRTDTTGSWSADKLHQANGGDYAADIIALGAELRVPVVDMTKLTKEKYDAATADESKFFHAWKANKSPDNTHLNAYGAQVVAQLLAGEIAKLNTLDIASHIIADKVSATLDKTTLLVQNPDWVDPATLPYAPPETQSTQCEPYVAGDATFYGTAMGDLGGSATAANHIRETVDGAMHIAVKGNKGKISSAVDGIVMYYYAVPEGKPFTLKAKATVTAVDTGNNQGAFGLMARDDMYIDQGTTDRGSLNSDYVAAGSLSNGSCANFARRDGALVKDGTLANPLAAGHTYDLQITRSQDGNYTCYIDGVAKTYDYVIDNIDTENTYVGMFCARNMDVLYSCIELTVDGVELCNTTAAGAPFSFSAEGWKFKDAKGAASAVAVDGGTLDAVTVACSGDVANAQAFVAVYDLQGKMTGIKPLAVESREQAVGLKMNGGETAKVFCLSKNSLAPLIEAVEKTSGVPTPTEPDVPTTGGPVQVWDFGGKVESNTDLYTNNITPNTLKTATLANGDALISAGSVMLGQNSYDFGDVTFTAGSTSDKFFSNIAELATLAGANKGNTHVHDFGDGYISAGGFITNGGGHERRRHVTVNNVQAGELVTVYLSNNQAETTYQVEGHAEIPSVTVKSTEFGVMSFVAAQDGNYKVWANGGKPGFLRVVVTPPVTVTGKITLPTDFDAAAAWGLKFIDPATKAETVATVDKTAKTYTVKLAPGRSYNASLTGANGWGMTLTTKAVAPTLNDTIAGMTHALGVERKAQYTYSGTITGFAQGYDTSKLAITMIPDADSVANAGAEDVELTLDGMNFTGVLNPGVTYTIRVDGVNDYAIKTPAPAEITSEGVNLTDQTITVEARALVAASGDFVKLDVDDQFAPLYADSTYDALGATVTKLTFTNVEDNYVYDGAVTADGGYTANLRAGAYLATATVDGYETHTHVVVADKAVSKDLLFVSTATPEKVAYAADLYVGDATKTPNFKTVTGALAYIKRMTDRTDDQRVTVHIAPGTYREQINIDVKNVTFVNDTPAKEVKLTWYYGIGYKYYSAKYTSNTEAWYDPELAFDHFKKAPYDVSRWGATVRVRASGFQAENITFENSLNYYVTDEEVLDGAEPNLQQDIRVAREYGADVTSKAATERAAAVWVDTNNGRGDMTEFKNCKLLSSQDTLGTGKRMYFKDCYIEGMTDYICGPGDVVFDTCTLNWKGYSDQAVGGYLTAPQTGASETGYLFRNCYVSGDTDLKLTGGAMGRTWGTANTGCTFLNTTLQSADMITEPTWIDMNGFDADQATKIHEWGTQLLDGTKVDLSTRQNKNTVLAAAPTIDMADYFGTWTPDYYTAEADTVAFTVDPSVSDNGDINLPRPGHTLTVKYSLGAANDANDASVIQWYAMKDSAETLVKTAVANADKTYQIRSADVGATIKVTVTPTTLSGKTGEAKSYTVAVAVTEGYDDPSNPVDPVLGEGVNLFLAGDSTVKDYSAAGMWTKGQNQTEGSWGEFLQQFFNDKVTVVDYAQGGRTTRSFIEQDKSLEKIDAVMKEGDFLCVQFGHNDCHTGDDRYVPLGITEAQKTYAEGGVYSDTVTFSDNVVTTVNGVEKTILPAGTYTTYTGYLKQYIAVTEKHGATAVLMTPVARMYYTSEGKIRTHHDATAIDGISDNEYCKAVKWVYDWAKAQGYNVVFLDNYQTTADLFEQAYADCTETDKQTYGKQLMASASEGTHNGKLGGFIWAGLVAQAIQNSDMTIAKAVKAPAQVTGKTPEGETAFTVNGAGALAAYDSMKSFAEVATYWQTTGQALFEAIGAKAAELNVPATPTEP